MTLVLTTREENAQLDQVATRVEFYMTAASAPATRKAYCSDMRQFERWCRAKKIFHALPSTAGAVACYVVEQATAGKKVATLERALVSIRLAHQAANYEDPTSNRFVREAMKGIRRRNSVSQKRAQPLLLEPLKKIVAELQPGRLKDARDRALLCLGFMTGMRRSELVALDVEDLKWVKRGLKVMIRRSKGDQEGVGREVVVFSSASEVCCVAAVRAWLKAAAIEAGPVFVKVSKYGTAKVGARLSDQVVRTVVKERAAAAGLEDVDQLSGHSLRAGLATQAALNGASSRDIAKQTGHKSEKILNGYIRDADLWRNNVTEKLGF